MLAAKKAKSPKRYIKTTVAVHDRTQLETVFDYFLVRGSKPASSPPPRSITGRTVRVDAATTAPARISLPVRKPSTLGYKVDVFLFYPRQFAINESTYPKEKFYADVRPMLRFREPKLGYKSMVGLKPGVSSPLVFLRDYVRNVAAGEAVEPVHNAIDEVRLFACAFIGMYLRGIDRNRRRIQRLLGGSEPPLVADIHKVCGRMQQMLERAEKTLQEFWSILDLATAQPAAVIEPLLAELQLVDEYCYYRMRDGVAYLLHMLSRLATEDLQGDAARLRQTILDKLSIYDARGAERGYMRIGTSSSNIEKERFIHRRGELKRRIWAVLFLEIRGVPLFAVQRQFGAMVAAGLAATWALVSQVLVLRQVLQPASLADGLGLSGLLFLSAGILAYIVKDRIKEIGRSYFRGGVFRRLPDHSERIYYNNRSGKPTVVGEIKETASFIAPEALPSIIAELRAATAEAYIYGTGTGTGTDGGAPDESGIVRVLHYAKSITLSSKLRILNRYPLRAVHDILRLNIDACLPRLGEPNRILDLVNADGDIEPLVLPKVYYLDMILNYSRLDQSGVEAQQALDYFRLVIDKNGLLRIERMN